MRNVRQLLVVGMMLAVAGGFLAAAVFKVREAADRATCQNNMRGTGLNLNKQKDDNGGLYPRAVADQPALPRESRLSWVFTVQYWSMATNLYVRMDRTKGWDAEENRYLALTAPRNLHCPAFPDVPPESTLDPTHYVGIAGLGADAITLPPGHPRAGLFGYERKVRLSDIEKHTSTLLAAIETTHASGAWTAGGWPTVRGLEEDGTPYIGANGQFGGLHPGRTQATFADGSFRTLRSGMDTEVIKSMATIEDSKGVGAFDNDW